MQMIKSFNAAMSAELETFIFGNAAGSATLALATNFANARWK